MLVWLPIELLWNATLGWGDEQLGKWLGITNPTVSQVYKAFVEFAPPLVLAALAFYLYHLWWSRQSQLLLRAPGPSLQTPDLARKAKLPQQQREEPARESARLVKIPEAVEPAVEKIFLSESVSDLIKQYSQRTALQSDGIFKSVYYGKWMLLELSIYEMTLVNKCIALACCEDRDLQGPFVMAFFDEQWKNRLSHLPKGTRLKICGQLKSVSGTGIRLEKCELK